MSEPLPGSSTDSTSSNRSTPEFSGHSFEGWRGGDNVITGFREVDRDGYEWDFPRTMTEAYLGSDPAECQIVLPVEGVSRRHLRLERGLNRLRLIDNSTNGTLVRGYRLERGERAEIEMGDMMVVRAERDFRLLALNDEMRDCRNTILDIVGTAADRSADDIMQMAAKSVSPLLLTGDPSSGLSELATLIHRISPRRGREFVFVDKAPDNATDGNNLVRRAHQSTLVLPLPHGAQPLKASFVEAIRSKSFSVQLIIVAHRGQDARAAFGEDFFANFVNVHIRELAYRRQDIQGVIDRRLTSRSPFYRFTDLTPTNQQALLDWPWPNNLSELREVVDGIAALAEKDTYRAAASAVGTSPAKLVRVNERLGLERPFFHW